MRKLSDITMLEIVSSKKSLILSVSVLNTAIISISFGSSFSSREKKKKKDSSFRYIGEDKDKTEIITGRDGKMSRLKEKDIVVWN